MSHQHPGVAPPQHPFPPAPQHQNSPSPINHAASFPPAKRPKLSPGTSPGPPSPSINLHSPYAASPGAGSPAPLTPSAALQSPAAPSLPTPLPPGNLGGTPYNQNGRGPANPMAMPMPSVGSPAPPTPGISTPQATANASAFPHSNATLMPVTTPSNVTPGTMGPPTIKTEDSFRGPKANQPKVDSYEMDDMLAGTGIDLDEEQQLMNDFEIRRGFGYNPAGGRDSFYGAGPMNQPGQESSATNEAEAQAAAADAAWNDAASKLAANRANELRHNLLLPGTLHHRLHNIAAKHNLGLNLDLKPDGKTPYMGRFQPPAEFPQPEIKVTTKPGPNGTIVSTHGSLIPKEAYLVDQLALLSLATKEHLSTMLGEANKYAKTRQQRSHGSVPPEWENTIPSRAKPNGVTKEEEKSATDADGSPNATASNGAQKRPADEMSTGLPTPVSEASPINFVADALVDAGKQSRNAEEARLKKRQRRLEKGDDKDRPGEEGGSRAGSVAPGTPIQEKAEVKPPTKKESKKAAKLAEASNTSVNATLSMFAGGSKKKKYSWMSAGASGANTPKGGGSLPGTPGIPGTQGQKTTRGPLTPNPNPDRRLGAWRETSERGKNIQLRDWVLVLEDRGSDRQALQQAYDRLEKSDMGDKVATNKTA